MLRITLLGRLAIARASGEPVVLSTRKAGAMFAVLALTPGSARSRDHLASLLWGGTTDEKARNSVRQSVFVIRRALAEDASALAQQGDALLLRQEAVSVDVTEFDNLCQEGTRPALEAAVALARGDLLEGLSLSEPAFDDWLDSERAQSRARVIDAATRLLALQEASGGGQEAIHTALRVLRLDPLQEAVHRTLMRLYAQQGRRGEALRQYRHCVNVLATELGVDPESETERLREEILLDASDRNRRAGAEPAAGRRSHAILVVEDDPVSRAMLEGALRGVGYTVDVAPDGLAALERLRQQRYDLVISDIMMPSLDGLALLEASSREGHQAPTVFVTSGLADELEIRGLELGARDYLRKPISRDVLLLRVANVLSRP